MNKVNKVCYPQIMHCGPHRQCIMNDNWGLKAGLHILKDSKETWRPVERFKRNSPASSSPTRRWSPLQSQTAEERRRECSRQQGGRWTSCPTPRCGTSPRPPPARCCSSPSPPRAQRAQGRSSQQCSSLCGLFCSARAPLHICWVGEQLFLAERQLLKSPFTCCSSLESPQTLTADCLLSCWRSPRFADARSVSPLLLLVVLGR